MMIFKGLRELLSKPEYVVSETCQVPGLKEKWETIFGRRRNGTFVEVGAFDGESFSNTSCLADVGWTGIYVEPIPEFAELCRKRHEKNKNVTVQNCAASDCDGVETIYLAGPLTTLSSEQADDYTRIDWAKSSLSGKSFDVKTERLDSILTRFNVKPGFDLLVIDVEGAEAKVMDGFTIKKWMPKVILIELEDEHPDFHANSRVVSSVKSVRTTIESCGYRLQFKDMINSLYVRV